MSRCVRHGHSHVRFVQADDVVGISADDVCGTVDRMDVESVGDWDGCMEVSL